MKAIKVISVGDSEMSSGTAAIMFDSLDELRSLGFIDQVRYESLSEAVSSSVVAGWLLRPDNIVIHVDVRDKFRILGKVYTYVND